MATGLPIVGTVHNASATGGFVRKLGLDAASTCSGPQEVADWLLPMSRSDTWVEISARSRVVFDMLQLQEALILKRALDKIA
jgi:hypothetical protein